MDVINMKTIIKQFEKIKKYIEIPSSRHARPMDEWNIWRKENKAAYPIRWFINESIPSQYAFLKRKYLTEPYWWVRHRTIERNNILKINSLTPGWHDRCDILLHSNFQILVDFVELELARMNFTYFEKYNKTRPGRRTRHADAGIDYLLWEINDPECNRGPAGSRQADDAKIKLELYIWWTKERPNRKEPWGDPQIWGEIQRGNFEDFMNLSPEKAKCGDIASELEQLYAAEDQMQLERLIKIRANLWC
jgi:hypothetical protein